MRLVASSGARGESCDNFQSRRKDGQKNDGQKDIVYHIRLNDGAANRSAAFCSLMSRTAKVALCTLIGTVALAASAFVYVRGERLADRLLRVGGRIVLSAAQRPKRVAFGFAAAVLLIWLAIGLRCAWESWRERRRARIEQPGSVANPPPPG
jgi:hypothetical protein